MQNFLNISYPFDISPGRRLINALWIGLGIFLFILFFQPFGIKETDLNNYLLLIAGFGGIAFLLQSLLHVSILPGKISFRLGHFNLNILLLFELLLWILTTVAFTFYLRYVANVDLSMFLVFRLALVSLLQPVTNMIIYEIHYLRTQLLIAREKDSGKAVISETKETFHIIELSSSTRSEKLRIKLDDFILARSAENYVEIHHRDEGELKMKLLRTTLSSIEDSLEEYSSVVRCHRTCIVNISQVLDLKKTGGGHQLIFKDFPEEVVVSRQYILQVKKYF
jgi:hypothetical protein